MMMDFSKALIVLFSLAWGLEFVALQKFKTRFTNVECTAYDKSFAVFRHCKLKVLRRGHIALNLHVELYKLPVTNVTLNLALLKKANGYRPFLYNFTIDFCKFMKNQNRNPFLKVFVQILQKDSNINHTCPYVSDIIIKDLLLYDQYFNLLPLPTGEYLFLMNVGAYNDWKAKVGAYVARSDDKD